MPFSLMETTSQSSAGATRSSGKSAISVARPPSSNASSARLHADRWLSLISPSTAAQ